MATFSYTKYTFYIPKALVENDYVILKEILTSNSKYNLNPPSGFDSLFAHLKLFLIFVGVGILGVLMLVLSPDSFLSVIGIFLIVIGGGALLSGIISLFFFLILI